MTQSGNKARNVTVLDLLLLVGVAGVMLWIYRGRLDRDALPASLKTLDDVVGSASWFVSLLPCAVAWTIAVLILTLRQPRPSLHRLSRQPGFIACLTASVVVLIGIPVGVIFECFFHVATGHRIAEIDWEIAGLFSLGILPGRISFAVAAAWVLQAILGRWRPQPNWIDRLGRATGFFWVLVIPLHELAGVGCLGS